MSLFFRLLILAALSWVLYVLCAEAHFQAHAENPDNDKIVLLFVGMILDGGAIALILTLAVVPALGDHVGSFFFNPSHTVEHDPHMDAIAKVAQGDHEGAIADYEKILKEDPSDTLAVSEIARICCRDLGDTPRAAAVLERALQSEWPHEQSSFLANRLADIYILQSDPMRARHLLLEIATTLEETKYAANALHRIHEIDRAMETGTQAPIYFEGIQEKQAPPERPGRSSGQGRALGSAEESA